MSQRLATIALVLGVIATCAGCSTPHTAPGSLAQGKERVVQLVLDAAHALPATSTFTPPTLVGTQLCRKEFLGYAAGSAGTHRAQVPLLVHTPDRPSIRALLDRIAAVWKTSGYTVDRSRMGESQYPQLRAHAPDGFDVVATGFSNAPQIDLYAVSGCLDGP